MINEVPRNSLRLPPDLVDRADARRAAKPAPAAAKPGARVAEKLGVERVELFGEPDSSRVAVVEVDRRGEARKEDLEGQQDVGCGEGPGDDVLRAVDRVLILRGVAESEPLFAMHGVALDELERPVHAEPGCVAPAARNQGGMQGPRPRVAQVDGAPDGVQRTLLDEGWAWFVRHHVDWPRNEEEPGA